MVETNTEDVKTLVIITVPAVGKSYLINHVKYLKDKGEKGLYPDCVFFDINRHDYRTEKLQADALVNLIQITRKQKLDSIIMVNYSESVFKTIRYNNIPYYAVIPPDRYIVRYYSMKREDFENFCNSLTGFRRIVNKIEQQASGWCCLNCNQYISQFIDEMWNDDNYFNVWKHYKG